MDLLLEIGCEELPATAVIEGLSQIEAMLPELLERVRLGQTGIRVLATPRRLAALVTGIPQDARAQVTRKKGPPLSKARKPDGSWEQAAIGFARSQGVAPDELEVEETGKGSYVFVVTEEQGRPARELLPAVLEELVGLLKFKKSMRWGGREERFSRPVRWLLALLDDDVLEFEFAGCKASKLSYGHRYLSAGAFEAPTPASYEEVLEKHHVVVDQARRRGEIIRLAEVACGEAELEPLLEGDVLDEVVMLVEWPGVVLGNFDERFLKLPREVLEHAMEEHQRYFPVEDVAGEIQACFIAVHNGDEGKADIIRKGHERVLAARLTDAEFFYYEDLKRPLAERKKDLEHVVYQSELGSMQEKSMRLARLVEKLGQEAGLDEQTVARAGRAAALAKCDLVTHMVVEFPSLQGIVGRIYTENEGEDERVAAAIAEQYLPRRLGDALPETAEGALLSLAEKADNLAASFGLGHVPTGSEDPYALRRQALGMLLVIVERELPLSVSEMVRISAGELEAEAHGFAWGDEKEKAFGEFFRSRARVFFTDNAYRYDLIEAALEGDWDRPLVVKGKLDALQEARSSGLLARLYTGFERCHNLSRGQETGEVDKSVLSEEAEIDVYEAMLLAEGLVQNAIDELDYFTAVKMLEPLCAPIDKLFDDVLIIHEDLKIRKNRLSLLARLDALFNRVADFSALSWD